MIPVLLAEQITRADLYTQSSQELSALELMERAALALAHKWMQEMGPGHKLRVICGMGNNGGDGLALTRILYKKGYDVRALLIQHKNSGSAELEAQIKLLQGSNAELLSIWTENDLEAPNLEQQLDNWIQDAYVVDALLGNGVHGPARAPLDKFIQALNTIENAVVAIDLPSGLNSDGPPFNGGAAVRAWQTWSFDLYKKCFFLKSARPYLGTLSRLPIGLRMDPSDNPLAWVPEREDVEAILPQRHDFAHKGELGRALIVAGSAEMGGAAMLCAESCLRSGAGLVKVALPEQHVHTLLTRTPEAMALPWKGPVFKDFDPKYYSEFKPTALAIGPGMGRDPETSIALKALLDWSGREKLPQVLDADALNLLPSDIVFEQETTVITPHLGEFRRLVGQDLPEELLWEQALKLSQRLKAVVVLKGAHTIIALDGETPFIMEKACPALAVPGSGDVLTGIIAALLARGLGPYKAAIAGTWLHLQAGLRAQESHGKEGLLAHEILDFLNRS